MYPLAVSAIDKLRHMPRKDLSNLGLLVLVLVIGIVIYKMSAKMNKLVLFMIVAFTLMIISFNWVYERNEPKCLTKAIDHIAPFFPSRPKY